MYGRDAVASEALVSDRVARSSEPPFILENRTGYDTDDLVRFFQKGLRATGTRSRDLRIVVVASPIRSRGCAEVGRQACSPCKDDDRETCCTFNSGKKMVIALAAPWRYSLRRLARLLEHEAAHIRGSNHEDMDHETLLSLGDIPRWAEDTVLRYRGRAPAQLPFLKGSAA